MQALCPCISSWFSSVHSDPSNPNSNRFCTICDMAPPLLAMVACIVGIAAALTLQCYWVCVPLGVGVLASGYMVHWANVNRVNKTLHENVADLYQVNLNLKEFERRLGLTTDKDEITAERLEAVALRLEEKEQFVAKLQEDLALLSHSAEALAAAPELIAAQKTVLEGLKSAAAGAEDKERLAAGLIDSNRLLAERLQPIVGLIKAIEQSGLQGHAKHLEQENAKLQAAILRLGQIEGRIQALEKIEQQLGGHVTQFATLLQQLAAHQLTMQQFAEKINALISTNPEEQR